MGCLASGGMGAVMADLVDRAEAAQLRAQIEALAACTMIPGCWDKRFITNVLERSPTALTENQRNQVRRLAYKYRRQLPRTLVPNGVKMPRQEKR